MVTGLELQLVLLEKKLSAATAKLTITLYRALKIFSMTENVCHLQNAHVCQKKGLTEYSVTKTISELAKVKTD